MEKPSDYIQEWLSWPNGKEPTDDFLEACRKEMYTALSLFHSHVKYVIYIMVTMPAAILAIMRFWPSERPHPVLYLIAASILIVILPVARISTHIIQKYYEVYVSALVFATRAHIAAGYQEGHPWLERTIKQAYDWRQDVNNAFEFLQKRTTNPEDSFDYYRRIINILSIACFVFGIVFVCLGISYLGLPLWRGFLSVCQLHCGIN